MWDSFEIVGSGSRAKKIEVAVRYIVLSRDYHPDKNKQEEIKVKINKRATVFFNILTMHTLT